MERTETESRQRLNNRIEQLETELVSMKTRLDQEVAQRHALGRTMDVCKVFLPIIYSLLLFFYFFYITKRSWVQHG